MTTSPNVATASGLIDRSTTVCAVPRPPTGHTFVARARVPKPKWDRFGELAEDQDTDRSKVLNDFIDWYLRVPGAKLPKRP
ncbi:MAG: hypothetical protein JWO67_4509 [Streptosporangiaceae bacterium]|nr:hypothetical protein [Streptosporangiaceae bacterium]